MLDHVLALEQVRLGFNFPPQVSNGLHLIDTIEQVADVLDHLLFFRGERQFALENLECLCHFGVVSHRALVLIFIDAEESFWVFRQTD